MQSASVKNALQWFSQLVQDKIIIEPVKLKEPEQNGISWDILRTDLIHPVCSGNKIFKLRYYLEDAILKNHTAIHSFGGAWSNHIVATALVAKACGLTATGYIRGEEPREWSQTLKDANQYGMKLVFLPRDEFDKICFNPPVKEDSYPIPIGGYGFPGAKGASHILDNLPVNSYTHIICAAGTGTMAAGLSLAGKSGKLVCINAVRNDKLLDEIKQLAPGAAITVYNDYLFGGFAKADPDLIKFMNSFFLQNSIPTDFVYTAKLMFAIQDLISKNAFPTGSRILAIHSGGLQGNKSLKIGQLQF